MRAQWGKSPHKRAQQGKSPHKHAKWEQVQRESSHGSMQEPYSLKMEALQSENGSLLNELYAHSFPGFPRKL